MRALVESPPGQILLAYTAMLSFNEIAEMWSRVTGQPAKHKQVAMEEVKKQFPAAGEETNSTPYAAEYGYAGGEPGVIEPEVLGFKSRPDDIEAWMREQDWSSIIALKDSGKL